MLPYFATAQGSSCSTQMARKGDCRQLCLMFMARRLPALATPLLKPANNRCGTIKLFHQRMSV
jgi:hypothetical protein